MDAKKQNYQLANQIGALLEKENCTVANAIDILEYVARKIKCTSHVQFPKDESVECADTVN